MESTGTPSNNIVNYVRENFLWIIKGVELAGIGAHYAGCFDGSARQRRRSKRFPYYLPQRGTQSMYRSKTTAMKGECELRPCAISQNGKVTLFMPLLMRGYDHLWYPEEVKILRENSDGSTTWHHSTYWMPMWSIAPLLPLQQGDVLYVMPNAMAFCQHQFGYFTIASRFHLSLSP